MFSLMDFYYSLIMISINTNVSEREYDTIQSDNMIDRQYRVCKQLSLRSAGTRLSNRLCVTTSLSPWACMSVQSKALALYRCHHEYGCLYLNLWVCSRWTYIDCARAPKYWTASIYDMLLEHKWWKNRLFWSTKIYGVFARLLVP